MKISIIVPVFNEEKTVETVLRKLVKLNLGMKKEIIVVDDGSIDKTKEILKRFENNKLIKIIHHKKNMGKGSAIKTGISKAIGGIITIQDSDLEYNMNNLKYLIEPIIEKKADAVYGSRFMKKNKAIYNAYYIGNKVVSLFASILYMKNITDIETCYKVFSRKAIIGIQLNARGFEFEPEITAKILKRGIEILEMPIDYSPRTKREGKKIRPKDGIIAIWTLIKCRF